ncbi:hypothetical protein BOQ54_00825 [Chelatococcus daeguensis]|uniref:Smr domain-containing protein n=1 Tax=Chelatococcus daeguensis TaxID=444444 RepID=A0AAC9NXA9_9HYPH|nr:Smr/MutS family protein [Chelatococcus daeguensis]APF36052.1 hypothetical protein BOQ54_00825 [Chelatococcus daeguensis]
MSRRRRRGLDEAELTLWRHVLRDVKPLPGRALPPPEAPKPPPAPPEEAATATMALRTADTGTTGRGLKTKTLPLAPLERRLRQALNRGTRAVDAKIDLHGLRQSEAHAALRAFLLREQARGSQLVIVVTGKGGTEAHSADLFGGERGVLRRLVPQWLSLPDLRVVVLGFEEAGRTHGGAGALYVRLRRRKSAGGTL